MGAPNKLKPITVVDAPLTLDRGAAKRIFISGFAGKVQVSSQSKSMQVSIHATRYIEVDDPNSDNADALRQIAIKTGVVEESFEIKVQLPPQRSGWNQWAQGKHVPQVKLEISAPDGIPLDIYWTRGDVDVESWHGSVSVTNQSGDLNLSDITGDVTVKTMFGGAKFENIRGNVNIENFSSHLNLASINGRVKLRTFSGETVLKKIKGNLNINSQKGAVTTQSTDGAMEIQTGLAAIKILEHQGSIRGHSEAGAIEAKIMGAVDAKLNSVSGPLSIAVPSKSQANVSMTTAKGDLVAPKVLERKRSPLGKVVRGNLSGSEQGVLRLTSDSGDLSLKVH